MKIILENIFKYENNCLFKISKQNNKWKNCNDNKPNSEGYNTVYVNKKSYKLHRLVYKYFNEDWNIDDSSLDNCIDHKDRNPLNNKIENLQIVNHSQNTQNKDFKGYHKHFNKYQTNLQHNGVRVHKYFCIEDDAIRFVELYRKKYYYLGDRITGLNNEEELELEKLYELGSYDGPKNYNFNNSIKKWVCKLKDYPKNTFKTEKECIDYRDKCLNGEIEKKKNKVNMLKIV